MAIKWYYRPTSVMAALLMFGIFAAPLLWRSPKYNLFWKIVLTIIFGVTTVVLLWKTWDLYVYIWNEMKRLGLI